LRGFRTIMLLTQGVTTCVLKVKHGTREDFEEDAAGDGVLFREQTRSKRGSTGSSVRDLWLLIRRIVWICFYGGCCAASMAMKVEALKSHPQRREVSLKWYDNRGT